MTQTATSGDSWPKLLDAVTDGWPPSRWRDLGIVVGCSGGADSVGLLTALCKIRETSIETTSQPACGFIVAAHFNHGLRGAESDADEAFVRTLSSTYRVGFATARSSVTRRDEAGLRTERLKFLSETANQTGARYVALAHSVDDNVETVLHHFLRGTGPAGLAGIGNARPLGQDLVLVRPLLQIRRTLIRDALEAVGQSWREDASNRDTDYRRNWIRHRLIPLIESEFPSAVDAVGRAIDGQREWRSLIDRLALDWLATHRCGDNPLTLRRDRSAEQPIMVAAAQILWAELGWPRGQMAREHWLRIATTIQGERPERYTLPGQIDVIARRDELEIG